MQAIDRYDGPLYQVLRKAIREGAIAPGIRFGIISARYGLIDVKTAIPFYDQRLDAERAIALGPQVRTKLTRLLASNRFSCIRINLGREYADLIATMPGLRNAIWASGSIGTRAATLKTWLRGAEDPKEGA